jgi:SAM-dependent methyltransferase
VVWNASAETLSPAFEPGTFDCVCAVEVLEHVENPMQALRNFSTMLKPGGLMLASTPNVSHPRSRLKFVVSGEPSYFGRTEYFSSGHRTILPDWLLELHLKEAGFEDVRLNYAGSLGLKGKQKLLYRGLGPIFRALGMLPGPRVADGCVTFAVGQKPE